jgi:hypothetical protein
MHLHAIRHSCLDPTGRTAVAHGSALPLSPPAASYCNAVVSAPPVWPHELAVGHADVATAHHGPTKTPSVLARGGHHSQCSHEQHVSRKVSAYPRAPGNYPAPPRFGPLRPLYRRRGSPSSGSAILGLMLTILRVVMMDKMVSFGTLAPLAIRLIGTASVAPLGRQRLP